MKLFNSRKKELQAALEKLEAAEARVRELEADFAVIEDHQAVLVMSPDGLIERTNALFRDAVGYQEHELVGQHHRVLCDTQYTGSEAYITFWRELVTGHAHRGLFTHVHADGHRIQLASRYLPVMSEKGFLKRIITLVERDAPAGCQ